MFRALFICAFLATTAMPYLAPEAAADEKERRTVSITVTGTIQAPPDLVEISTGVTSQADTARKAVSANNEAMAKVVEALKGNGIEPKDIQTTNFSVEPLYERRNHVEQPKVVGYRARNTVNFKLREIPRLGDVLDKVVSLGSNQIGGITFSVEEPDALMDEARKKAMANAMARASLYAEAAGAKLGQVVTINEQQDFHRPFMRTAIAEDAMAASPPVPIEGGTNTLEVRLSVTWELE
jgi:uncharacterized protein